MLLQSKPIFEQIYCRLIPVTNGSASRGQLIPEKVPTSVNTMWEAYEYFSWPHIPETNIGINHICGSTNFREFSQEEIRLADYSTAPLV
jgi:hypothetical protein